MPETDISVKGVYKIEPLSVIERVLPVFLLKKFRIGILFISYRDKRDGPSK